MSRFNIYDDNLSSDEIQFQKFINGDKSAIDSIYRKYYQNLFLYGQRFNIPDFEIEETIHDLFLNLFKYRKSLKNIDNVKSYIFRSFRNLLIRRQKKDQEFILINDIEEEEETETIPTEQLTNRVKELINKLSPREKEIILLKFYENQSNSEIANILGIDYITVRNLISRAFKKIRKLGKGGINLFFLIFALGKRS